MLELVTILKSYGWAGIILAFCLFSIYKVFHVSLLIVARKFHSRFVENKQKKLLMHTFFTTIQHALDVDNHTTDIFMDKPVRQSLMKDLVICSLGSMQEIGIKMANENYSGWSDKRWSYGMKLYITEIHSSFINKCILKGIPKIVYMKYMDWFFDHMDYMRNTIDQIANDSSYPNLETKTSTVLLFFSLMISALMVDSEKTLRALNGAITGSLYNGAVIEDCG